MKKTAIICEINPYHNGHRALFTRAREESGGLIVAVMSGNLTQRAAPAVFEKYRRARWLVTPTKNGPSAADLVVELPFPWCAAGAEGFALGGTAVALGMGAEELVCGREAGEGSGEGAGASDLWEAARAKESAEYRARLSAYEHGSRRGEGSAALSDAVMREMGFALGPNERLAVEYRRSLWRLGSRIPVLPVARIPCPSAAELRERLFSGEAENVWPYVPSEVYRAAEGTAFREEPSSFSPVLKGSMDEAACGDVGIAQSAGGGFRPLVTPERFYELLFLFCRLFFAPSASFAESGGGLAAHLRQAAAHSGSAEEFWQRVRTKKYTDARLRRAILFAMLRVEEAVLKDPPRYTVLLAANEAGRAYLSFLRKERGQGTFAIVTKPASLADPADDSPAARQYRYLLSADGLYALLEGQPAHAFLKRHPAMM